MFRSMVWDCERVSFPFEEKNYKPVKGNVYVLNEYSKENRTRYTAIG